MTYTPGQSQDFSDCPVPGDRLSAACSDTPCGVTDFHFELLIG